MGRRRAWGARLLGAASRAHLAGERVEGLRPWEVAGDDDGEGCGIEIPARAAAVS
jgi:hypothetical protein